MHLGYENTNVMTQDLTKSFVNLPNVRLASDGWPELALNHAEHGRGNESRNVTLLEVVL